jgi:DNA-directed RNA polymerase subunit M/transcription elongation factor TFIIS
MVRIWGRKHGISEDLITDLDKALSECQREFVRYTQSLARSGDAEPTLFARAAE